MLKDLMTEDEFIEITASSKISYNYRVVLKRLVPKVGEYEDAIVEKVNKISDGIWFLKKKLEKERGNNSVPGGDADVN